MLVLRWQDRLCGGPDAVAGDGCSFPLPCDADAFLAHRKASRIPAPILDCLGLWSAVSTSRGSDVTVLVQRLRSCLLDSGRGGT